MEYKKLNETTLEVANTVTPETVKNTYKLDFLSAQELSILKQRNEFIAARDKELAEVRTLIAKCKELGIKSELEIQKALEITLK